MPEPRETLRKSEILRCRHDFQKLIDEGRRVRGKGVTLFFYHLAKGGSG